MTQTKRHVKKRKQERTPFGVPRYKLTLNGYHIPGYKMRWVNDVDDQIFAATEGGYEHVSKDEVPNIGDRNVVSVEGIGSVVSKRVGAKENGEPMYAYLMKIEKELYDEDQELKEEQLTGREGDLMGGEDIENAYVPKGANHGITRD